MALKFRVNRKTLRDGWTLVRANDNPKLITKGLGVKPKSVYYFTYGNDRGYIAFSDNNGGIKATISVAGTDDIQDWKENGNVKLDPMGRHSGFCDPAKEIWEKIIEKHVGVWKYVNTIEFRAHSRGGAICVGMAEFAFDISKGYSWGSNITGIIYGAPMYGDERWTVRMSSAGKRFIRVENKFDPVPHIPLKKWGYAKECDSLKIKQPWFWAIVPIRSHLWYGITLRSCLTKKTINKFNNR